MPGGNPVAKEPPAHARNSMMTAMRPNRPSIRAAAPELSPLRATAWQTSKQAHDLYAGMNLPNNSSGPLDGTTPLRDCNIARDGGASDSFNDQFADILVTTAHGMNNLVGTRVG